MKATLTFPTVEGAKSFASAWVCRMLTGYDMSKVKKDGSVYVTVYDVDEEKKKFIEDYLKGTQK